MFLPLTEELPNSRFAAVMPIATPSQFAAMLDAAQEGGYAYPAINCSSITTLNAALKGFADNKSDGIIQFSTGAGQFASGLNHKNATKGTIILAEAAHALAEQFFPAVAVLRHGRVGVAFFERDHIRRRLLFGRIDTRRGRI